MATGDITATLEYTGYITAAAFLTELNTLNTGAATAGAQEKLTLDALKSADYMKGKQTFQGRCSACHTLADDSGDIAGPNLWGVFDREAGSKEGFGYSETLAQADFQWSPDQLDAGLADPQGYLPGNIMGIPEAVP